MGGKPAAQNGALAAMRAIRDAKIAPPTRKLVAFVLASYANVEGGDIRPGLERVASECGTDVRTVRRHVRALEAAGVLLVAKRSAGRKPTEYRLDVNALRNPDTSPRVEESGSGRNPDSGDLEPGRWRPRTRVGESANLEDLNLPGAPPRSAAPGAARSGAKITLAEARERIRREDAARAAP